jgi:hypothetical protein
VVYRNDFDARPGASFPEWSSSRITYSSRTRPPRSATLAPQAVTNVESPKGRGRFLGEFGGPRVDPTARTQIRQALRLGLEFASDLFEGKGTDDESWGLDNVRVSIGEGKRNTAKAKG